MDYEAEVTFEGEYVLVHAVGKDSYWAASEIWSRVAEVCEENKCFNVLRVQEMTPLSLMDAYNHWKIFQAAGITTKYCIAWVEKDPEVRAMIGFVGTVLYNRSMFRGRVFLDVSEAKKWLLGNQQF